MTRSSRQRGEMICTVCKTRTSPLWRRGEKGEVLCNACGLYHKHHNKPRPISLANSSSRSVRRSSHQNNENKIQGTRFQSIYPNMTTRPSYPFSSVLAPALSATVSQNAMNINSTSALSPPLYPLQNYSNQNNGPMSDYGNMNISPSFKMTTAPIPISMKNNNNNSNNNINTSPLMLNSLSPPLNSSIKPNLMNNSRKLPMLPAPIAQKNIPQHYYPLPIVKEEKMNAINHMNSVNHMNNNNNTMNNNNINGNSGMNHGLNKNNNNNTKDYIKSKVSIASIMNSTDTPINTSISSKKKDSYMYDHQDIEAAHLLISLRDCEKVY